MTIALNMISLLGGLAMFLYGMRLMGANLKEGSSGTLKLVMEKVTNNHIKAFFLGLAVTAIIQSSTATIVITSGLVAAGIISLDQSLGIIIGANVGTTVTGQIIRLLDVNAEAGSVLQFLAVNIGPSGSDAWHDIDHGIQVQKIRSCRQYRSRIRDPVLRSA